MSIKLGAQEPSAMLSRLELCPRRNGEPLQALRQSSRIFYFKNVNSNTGAIIRNWESNASVYDRSEDVPLN